MFDFLEIRAEPGKKGVIEIFPDFKLIRSKDLMIRGGDFYAIWLESQQRWSTDEQDVLEEIDKELDKYAEEHKSEIESKFEDFRRIRVKHIGVSSTRLINSWHTYIKKDMRDRFVPLDEKIIFKSDAIRKEDYSTKRVGYDLTDTPTPSYDKLMSVLYSDEERRKIEWAIGAVLTGDSKRIQKFLVLYGASGTGKSTVLNIIQQLFDGYYSTFDSKSLGSASNAFALEAFRTNPLVAIQHDGDLSRIEDNTRLNSLISHELMTVNVKFEKSYSERFNSFLFMGTNKPVKITDAKSGIIRRLIDVSPTGKLVPAREYKTLMNAISFELGGIAYHCKELYLDDPGYYDKYIPEAMISASNDFYNFVLDSYFKFKKENEVSLATAYEMYNTYCDDAKVPYPLSRRAFKEELKNYFDEFVERVYSEDGSRLRSIYKGFRATLFDKNAAMNSVDSKKEDDDNWLSLKKQKSILDEYLEDCPAQYTTDDGTPRYSWEKVRTKLKEIDTSKLHYVLSQAKTEKLLFIDFDKVDKDGKKSLKLNLEAASTWPPTYAEVSKSGQALHLLYLYEGDVNDLDPIYDDHIEVKVFPSDKKTSMRRKLSVCNNVPIASISSGLPFKEKITVTNNKEIKDEKHLRRLLIRTIHKEYQPGTKPSMEFAKKLLDEAYEAGFSYDISDLYDVIWDFAANSTNHADYCLELVSELRLKSKDLEEAPEEHIWAPEIVDKNTEPITIYDVEVFPNLFLICWKYYGVDMPVVHMFNPTPDECLDFSKKKLVGFNCRKYDNHMVYGRIQHLTEDGLFQLSQGIISDGNKNLFYGAAYDMSYTDIYDYCSKKQSLKKWEIELGISHKELGLPWDQPVPEDKWREVAEYCDNDVLATEAVFDATQGDFLARKILADIAGMNYNTPTNTLTQRIIFGGEKHPQSSFNYRNLAEGADHCLFDDEYTCFTSDEKPVFPRYEYKYIISYSKDGKKEKGAFKSLYRGEEVGEGGYVYAEPGIHFNVALLDIASMHPHSAIAEWLFGKYTQRFKDLVDIRLAIKHKDFEKAKSLFDGKLSKYLDDPDQAKQLSQALKIAINSVYGLTSAGFDNPFRDKRNKDNIVAKRGALFMINLKHQVQKRGFTVAHIKTDSIKIPDATPEIIQFVMEYGKMYGYTFEHEATYEKMCLVNDAVYIAKYADTGEWTATGTQFQVPYVFKTLFSHEPIEFSDMCETKSVTGDSALYLDMNEFLPDVSVYEKMLDKKQKEFKKTNDPSIENDISNLKEDIAKGHNYQFIGRVGRFCPVKDGCGGGLLYRYKDGKYYSATGSSQEWTEDHDGKTVKVKRTYRWLESEVAQNLGTPIEKAYYEHLVEEAKKSIELYGKVDEFCA